MTSPTTPDFIDAKREGLPDNIRIPLHSLQADTRYLFGRVATDGSVASAMAESVLSCLNQLEEAVVSNMRALQEKHTSLAIRADQYRNQRDAAQERIENAAQAMAETHRDWQSRCFAIVVALGRNFGTPPNDEVIRAQVAEEIHSGRIGRSSDEIAARIMRLLVPPAVNSHALMLAALVEAERFAEAYINNAHYDFTRTSQAFLAQIRAAIDAGRGK